MSSLGYPGTTKVSVTSGPANAGTILRQWTDAWSSLAYSQVSRGLLGATNIRIDPLGIDICAHKQQYLPDLALISSSVAQRTLPASHIAVTNDLFYVPGTKDPVIRAFASKSAVHNLQCGCSVGVMVAWLGELALNGHNVAVQLMMLSLDSTDQAIEADVHAKFMVYAEYSTTDLFQSSLWSVDRGPDQQQA